jgi:hypothetical protein
MRSRRRGADLLRRFGVRLHGGLEHVGHQQHGRTGLGEHLARLGEQRQRGLCFRPLAAQDVCTRQRRQGRRPGPGVARTLAHHQRLAGVQLGFGEGAARDRDTGARAFRQ